MQKAASSFFEEKIKESTFFEGQNVIRIDYMLKDQYVDMRSVQTTLTGEIVMTYSGHVMDEFHTLLSMTVDNQEIEDLVRTYVQDGFFGQTTTSSSVKYDSNGDSLIIANSSDNYMLVFIILISVSGFLALTTFVLLISSKCRSGARRRKLQQQDLKISRTMETEDPVSPTGSGILGANVQGVGDGNPIITPQRNIVNSHDETPMSMDSTMTDAKSLCSTTSSKAPLGIMSMNNLRKLMFSPERKKSTIALYNVGLDDDDDDDDENDEEYCIEDGKCVSTGS